MTSRDAISDREAKAIEAATSVGTVSDPWAQPVHAVDRALGLSSNESRDLLRDLQRRKLLTLCPEGGQGKPLHLAARWKLGPDHPDTPKD